MLSSSRKGAFNQWGWPSSWALKRISSTSPSNSGAAYPKFNEALGSEWTVPGQSEVLWKENLNGTGKGVPVPIELTSSHLTMFFRWLGTIHPFQL